MDTTLEQSLQKAKSVERQRETILPRLAELRELGKRLNGELTNLLTAQSIGEPVAQGKIDGLRRKLKDVEEEIADTTRLAEGLRAAQDQLRTEEAQIRLAICEARIPGVQEELEKTCGEYRRLRAELGQVVERYHAAQTKAECLASTTHGLRRSLGIPLGDGPHFAYLGFNDPSVGISVGQCAGDQRWNG